jgi:uncharacterized protein (TIGR03085 family)
VSEWAQRERRALVEVLRELGPEAPTACDGWTTSEMAAHLYVRERRPDAAPGVVLPGAFSRHTDRVMDSVLRVHSYDEVVQRVADGPPLPLRPLDEAINLSEFFVHHEDVRRANGRGPRELPAEMERLLWRRLRPMLRVMYRRAKGVRVDVAPATGDRATVGEGPTVRLAGAVGELVLYSFDRKEIADVTLTGDDEARAILAQAHLGP